MAFGLFKKKEDDEIPDDVGFETPPTLANPMGFSNQNQMATNPGMPNLPPLPGPQTQSNNQNMNFNNQYQPPYQPTHQQTYQPMQQQSNFNPDMENQIKLLQAKVESMTVQLNTISQKLDYIINVLRSQGYKF